MSMFDRLEKARIVSAINARPTTPEVSITSTSTYSLSKPQVTSSVNNKEPPLDPTPSKSKKTFLPTSSILKRNINQLMDVYDHLPDRIILYRHAESAGNADASTYACTPDHAVRLTPKGQKQSQDAGRKLAEDLRAKAEEDGLPPRVFFISSPYTRTLETMDGLIEALDNSEVIGVKTAVHLREQDFGNFQIPERMSQDQEERTRFSRFYYRFPNGEAGSDVLIRISIFCEGLIRDMGAGKYKDSTLVLVTHGLTLRIFLMKWFGWSVEQGQNVYNPRNCDPIVIQKFDLEIVREKFEVDRSIEIEQLYEISEMSRSKLRGLTEDMASHPFTTGAESVRERWLELRAADKKATEVGLAGHGSGRISIEELEEVLRRRGEMTDDEIKSLIQEADVDGDGDINYHEFVTILTRRRPQGMSPRCT